MDHQVKFVVEASEAESITQKLGLPSVRHLLPVLVEPAQSLARPPISNYHVGAVGLGSDGRLFLGVNLEFPGLPLNHSVHAEQFLLTNLAVHNCPRLVAFAVSAAPCGHCRQFLQELRNPCSLQIHITSQHQNNHFEPLREILPNPFGPFDLLDDETPLLLERHNNGLSLLDRDGGDLCNGFDSNPQSKRSGNLLTTNGFCKYAETERSTLLKIAALEAANNSHAPYSGCPSGVAIMDCDGKIYKGSYVESAAYNPSLGPVQAALVAFVAGGGGGYQRIVEAALVEKETANAGKFSKVKDLLSEMQDRELTPNVVTYGALIAGWLKEGLPEKAFKAYFEMREKGLNPNVIIASSIISGLCKLGRIDDANMLLQKIVDINLCPELKHIYSFSNSKTVLSDAQKIADSIDRSVTKCVVPNNVVYNIAVAGLCKLGKIDDSRDVINYFSLKGFTPDEFTYCTLVHGMSLVVKVNEAFNLHDEMLIKDLVPNIAVYNALINGLCKAGNIERASRLFNTLHSKGLAPNVITYNTLIDGYYKIGKTSEAVQLLKRMTEEENVPS